MKRRLSLFATAALALALAGGCSKTDKSTNPDGNNGNGGPGVPNVVDSLVIARDFPALFANGMDQITVRATVVDGVGHGMSGVGVHFICDHGKVTAFATTSSAGIAEAVLTSEASALDLTSTVVAWTTQDSAAKANPEGDAHVLVSRLPLSPAMIGQAIAEREEQSAGKDQDSQTIGDVVDVPMTGLTITVSANPTIVPADGITESKITARIVETTRRVPLAQEEVRFGASTGSITGSVMTDETGAATASLKGEQSGAQSQITAYYGPTLTATTSVTFSALSLTAAPESPALMADGVSATQVIAHLVNAQNNPVPGARIEFATTQGTITSQVATDNLGAASAVLVADDTTGTATITVRFGDALSTTTQVVFTAIPTAATLLLSVDPTTLPADGASIATLTATALDSNGDPVPDGTAVTFSLTSGAGHIVAPLKTTIAGHAEANYIAGTTAGTASFHAVSGSAEALTSLSLTPLNGGTLALSASSPSILADGIASTLITATVTDAFGNPVAAGTQVQFTTSLGALESATPTDASGAATIRLRATRFETGLARVTAVAGEARKTLDVTFVSEAAAHIEAVSVDHPRIGVIGASDHETSTILFEVQDRNGIPVDEAHAVTLTFSVVTSSGNPDPTTYPASAVTNSDGQAAVTLNAGTMSGTVEVRATSGTMTSQPIQVAIHGDLPDPSHFSIFPEKLNIAGLVFGLLQDRVCAKVGDTHGNPVPDSTAVWFYSDFGLVQGSGFTNDLGDACAISESGAPFPAIPGGDGLVEICGQTISKAGQRITTCTNVMWSGPTIVEITSPASGFNVPNGGSITITYKVRDANNNPLTAGTTIKVSTTAGMLGGDVSVTLPDTQDRAFTTFTVTLSDDDPTQSLAKAATVTVSVGSQNGNRNASITGTVN